MKPYFTQDATTLYQTTATRLPLADESVQCCVTSPPYWGLRDYGVDGQIGAEDLHDCLGWATMRPCGACYVCHLVEAFREVRRTLAGDGVAWVNLGDCYATTPPGNTKHGLEKWATSGLHGTITAAYAETLDSSVGQKRNTIAAGLKPKDLCLIPARVALALQADGWWVRSDVIWHKEAILPESVTDRPTKAHEYLFMLAKAERYYYDSDAVREPSVTDPASKSAMMFGGRKRDSEDLAHSNEPGKSWEYTPTRNRRSVWTVNPRPYPGAHFATYPPELIEPCVLSGSRPGDTVLDPFNGSGTTGEVCRKWGRRYVGCDLNAEYLDLSIDRYRQALLFPVGGAA